MGEVDEGFKIGFEVIVLAAEGDELCVFFVEDGGEGGEPGGRAVDLHPKL